MIAVLMAALLLPASVRAERVVAVLSSELPVYREALEGFVAAHGSPVPVLSYQERFTVPPTTEVVVAFGSRAALASYPRGARVVAVAAPAAESRGRRSLVAVRLLPTPDRLVAAARKALPDVSRLGILRAGPALDDYMEELAASGRKVGLSIVDRRLESSADLPDALRRLDGRVEALWLPPDPALLTPRNFSLITTFSKSANVPLYAPTPGLIDRGATGCLGVTFRAAGRAAADVTRRALAGQPLPRFAYAEELDLVSVPTVASETIRSTIR